MSSLINKSPSSAFHHLAGGGLSYLDFAETMKYDGFYAYHIKDNYLRFRFDYIYGVFFFNVYYKDIINYAIYDYRFNEIKFYTL